MLLKYGDKILQNLLLTALLLLGSIAVKSQIPYYFIENRGQFNGSFAYRADIDNGTLFVENNGYTLSFYNNEQMQKIWGHNHQQETDIRHAVQFHALKFRFIDATASAAKGENPFKTYHNYYLGKNPERWKTKVPLFAGVLNKEVYPGIGYHIFNHQGALKSEWLLQPHANPNLIQIAVSGHQGMQIADGSLHFQTSVNTYIETAPVAWQIINGKKVLIDCHYIINGDAIGFQLGSYNPEHALVIDPVLVFSTYSGSRGDNFGFTATYDSRSNLYAGGIVDNEKGEYPVTAGAFQVVYGGGIGTSPVNLACDISISKYDSSGSNLLYATYLGGEGDEYPHSLVVDNQDNLIVFGTTNSADFPVTRTSYDTMYNGQYDIIVSKFAADGSALLGSTYIGGGLNDGLNNNTKLRFNYADDFRGDVIVDDADHVFVATTTFSSDFPVVKGFQTNTGGSYDGCLIELSPNLEKLLWSTYVGGSGIDALYSIKLDPDYIYAGGGTSSSNLDTTKGVLFETLQGDVDGFLVKVNKSSRSLKALSYWGTPAYDQVYFIELDARNSLYVAGQTEGSYTISPGVYGKNNKGQFIARLSLNLDSIYWQTTFGNRNNKPDISPSAFLVDKCNHIYLSGWGSTVRPDLNPGSTEGLEISPGALQSTTDSNDFYILVLDKDAQGLLYATYFGGNETDDHVDGGTSRFDKRGVIYQSVCSSCPAGNEPGHNDFPVTPNAAFIKNVSPRCSNASFKIDLQIKDAIISKFTVTPAEACRPLNAVFNNQSTKARRYLWDFGDGTTDTLFNPPPKTYDKAGEYLITLTAVDSLSCNITDKYEIKIKVNDKPTTDFTYSFDGCTEELKLQNKSAGYSDLIWYFGDGDTSTQNNPRHKYAANGTYKIVLITNPDSGCPDTLFKNVNVKIDGGSTLILPNVFTPNNDGKNDCFHPDGLNPDCDEMEWFIYNRWGELVFYSKDLNACWDGNTKSGEPYPAGAYFTLFKITTKKGKKETISGTVTLIR